MSIETSLSYSNALPRLLDDRLAERISVTDFGAKADSGITDNAPLIQNAWDALEDSQALFLPATRGSAYYGIGDTVAFTGKNRMRVYSDGMARVEMSDKSKPAFLIGGTDVTVTVDVEGLDVRFKGALSGGDTDAIALKVQNLAWSKWDRINVWNAYDGIRQVSEATANPAGNVVFNNSFGEIYIGQFFGHGVRFQPYQNANTQNYFAALFLSGVSAASTTCVSAFDMRATSHVTVEQMNIEKMTATRGLVRLAVASNIGRLYFEGAQTTNISEGWLQNVSGGCNIGQFHIHNTEIARTGLDNDQKLITEFSADSTVRIGQMIFTDVTVAAGDMLTLSGTSAGGSQGSKLTVGDLLDPNGCLSGNGSGFASISVG